MAEYVSCFVSGFESAVSQAVLRELGGAVIIRAGGGLIHFRYAGKPEYVARLPFINNSFAALSIFYDKNLTFEKMVGAAAKKMVSQAGGLRGTDGGGAGRSRRSGGSGRREGNGGCDSGRREGNGGSSRREGNGGSGAARSFRVRFSNENRFEKVPAGVMETAERAVMLAFGMRVDRLSPDCEFWYIIRRGGRGFFGRLLDRPADPRERGANTRGSEFLEKGELRPELACLLCLGLDFNDKTVVCDPFAGYGSIPLTVQKHYPYAKLYAGDADEKLVKRLKTTRLGNDPKTIITHSDAAELNHIPDGGVDLLISDPPWGFVGRYGDIAELYLRALTEFKRVTSESGAIRLLTGKPAEMAAAARRSSLIIKSQVNILVNGKKATVFTLRKNKL